MKSILLAIVALFQVSFLFATTTRNVQDNYKFIYTILDSTGDYVPSQSPTLKLRRLSDDYWYDFADNTFKASGWTNKFTTLTEDAVEEYYYYLYNPPASEDSAEQYLFVVDNTAADYLDHQTESVCYQDIGNGTSDFTVAAIADGVLDADATAHDTAGTVGAKINDAGTAGDPWSTTISSATYPVGTAGHRVWEVWLNRLRR
jgi:hypothetical protein